LKTLEYKKILDFAIISEIQANEYYLAIAKKAKDASVKQLFTGLAADELAHRKSLEACLKTTAEKCDMLVFAKPVDYKISETVKKPEITADMKFVDAIALAMKNEQEAMDMYKAMAASSQGAEQKKMFESLAVMEEGHKANLENIYNNAAFAEVW
jgi:rubrerythrin